MLLLVVSITVVIVVVVAANIAFARNALTKFVAVVVIFIVFVAVIASLTAGTCRRIYALDSDSLVVACDCASLDLPSSTLPNTQHGHFSFNAKRYLGWLIP